MRNKLPVVDLSTQHAAADIFARLVVQGVISQAEVIQSLIAASRKAGSKRSERELENEFVWSLAAAMIDWSNWRDMAWRHLQRAVAEVPDLTIQQAHRINGEYGTPLLIEEVRALLPPRS